MKQIFSLFSFLLISTTMFAQKLKDVKESIGGENWDIVKSKELVDKYLSNPKNAEEAEAWYYKGIIYNAAAKKEELRGSCSSDCKMEAFEALKKYLELDKKGVLLVLNQNAAIFDIYNTAFDMAVKSFNARDYSGAFVDFEKALQIENFIVEKDMDYNGFKFPALDTSLIKNIAMSARLSKDDKNAIKYYQKLSDANVAGPEYLEVYESLVDYARTAKDSVAFQTALAKGKELYPNELYWSAIEIEEIEVNGGTKEDVLKKYGELVQESAENYTLAYNYAVELYNYIYHGEKPKNIAEKKEKLKDVLLKAIELKPNADVKILAARFFYNSSLDNSDAAARMKDVQKKKTLSDAATADMNATIPYAEEVVAHYESLPEMKVLDKANYRVALSILKDIYDVKKDAAKAGVYDKKIQALK